MKTNIIPSFSAAVIGMIAGAWLWHNNPIIGMAGGPVLILSGLLAAWLLKPKSERIITPESAKKAWWW